MFTNVVTGVFLFGSDEDSDFCISHGGQRHGMIMYMDGFRRTYNTGHPCLNLFFPEWTLDSRAKFTWAIFGVFMLSIAAEGMSKLRRNVVLSVRRSTVYNNNNNHNHQRLSSSPGAATTTTTTTTTTTSWQSTRLRLVVTILHGAQALVGYLLMLATMTFSVELLCSVVVGLATGYALFFRQDDFMTQQQHVTSNPCCNFMEGEARENNNNYHEEDDFGGTTILEGSIDDTEVDNDTDPTGVIRSNA